MLTNLIKWEKENGYKACFIAQKLGITESAYSKIKLGKQKPTIEIAYRFQEVFGVDNVLELLTKEGSYDERQIL